MSAVKRSYHSPRRREQAEDTRRRILAAARKLFASEGYGQSTIESIATTAGVSVQTVYATFGSKGMMLTALLDQMALDADPSLLQKQLQSAAGDPRRQLRAALSFNGRLYSAGFDLIDLARTVSGLEPDLAAMWQAGEKRRYDAISALVAEWARAEALAPGLSARAATDMLWAFSGPDIFRLLVKERSWSNRRRVAELSRTLERTLFKSST
jgi:AcrR family transcriptional regulator